MSKQIIAIQLPITLSLGGRPLSQIAAAYHYNLSQGSYSVQSYASEWGWTIIETKIFVDQIALWHDPCNINNNSSSSHCSNGDEDIVVVGFNNSKIENNNTTTTTTKQRRIEFPEFKISIEIAKNTPDSLYQYFNSNTKCLDLIQYWYELFTQMGRTVEVIDSKQLGVISAVCRQNNEDKARKILSWAFNSDDGKAKFMREKGYLYPSSLLNRNCFVENFNLANNWKEQSIKKPASISRFRSIPTFDSKGNLIKGDK